MLMFVLGCMVGGFIGVVTMCLCIMNAGFVQEDESPIRHGGEVRLATKPAFIVSSQQSQLEEKYNG